MQKITIAIDGYSSTGKSTVAKQLAKHLGYVYVDSGAMYRAVTLFAIQNHLIGKNFFNKEKLIAELPSIKITFAYNTSLGFAEVVLNGTNVEKEIRTLEVSSFVSQVSAIPEVRRKMVEQQQKLGKNKGVVMDGRDIGTVVFPFAELKVFMTASPEIRAKRRYDELLAKGEKVTYEEIVKNVKERDYIDTHRADSPLLKAPDAIEIDNSSLTVAEQFAKILSLTQKVLEQKNKSNF
ncbi:MAG TPA: (d)CMP kinase [Flavobacteriaceae bacterium]|nr:(d)CMP kinase [Flavobacteriaceae bacterium]